MSPINHAHSTCAEFILDPIRSNACSGRDANLRRLRYIHERATPCRPVERAVTGFALRKKRDHFLSHFVRDSRFSYENASLIRVFLQSGQEKLLYLAPALRRQQLTSQPIAYYREQSRGNQR
jgi:hypothetical protein